MELWRSGEGFTLSFTGAEIVELGSFRRRQIGSDELTVISFFEERLLDAGYIAARPTHQQNASAAWTILNERRQRRNATADKISPWRQTREREAA